MSSNLHTRVFIVSGPSQLLFLSAALTKDAELDTTSYTDVLIFSGESYPEEKKTICLEIAHKVWKWHAIEWLSETNYFTNTNPIGAIHSIFNIRPNQLWVCMPFGKVELAFQKYFYDTFIVRFDDGLGTYVIPRTILQLLQTPSFLIKQVKLYMAKLSCFMRDVVTLKRFSLLKIKPKKRYGLFASFVGDFSKDLILVDWSYLKIQLNKFKLYEDAAITKLEDKTCLIVGQYFSLLGFLDREEEIIHYKKLCQYLYNQGYNILWKEHPKNRKPFYDELKITFPQIQDFNNYHSSYWPLEIVVKGFSIDLFIATTSTSIVLLDKVLECNTKSSSPIMIDKLQGADKQVAGILVKRLRQEQLIKQI